MASCPECDGQQLVELKHAYGTDRYDMGMNEINWQISSREGTVEKRFERIEEYSKWDGLLANGINRYIKAKRAVYSTQATNYINKGKFLGLTISMGEYFGYGEGVMVLGRSFMKENKKDFRNVFSLSKSDYKALYRVLGATGKTFGRISNVGSAAVVYSDLNAVQNNETSLARFSYRTSTLITSIYIGAAIGGVPGTVGGVIFGGAATGVEYVFDNIVTPVMREIGRISSNVEMQLRNGWRPTR